MSQLELFIQPVVAQPTTPSVESVRERLQELLNLLRGADVMPLTAREMTYWKVVTPQMSNWLPSEEKVAICDEFDAHLARLQTPTA